MQCSSLKKNKGQAGQDRKNVVKIIKVEYVRGQMLTNNSAAHFVLQQGQAFGLWLREA
jgi:hypothetical protein